MKPLLDDSAAAREERAIGATSKKDYQRPALTVRSACYRYSESEDCTPVERFDYASDPSEWHNLVNHPKPAGVRQQLAAILSKGRT